MWRTRPVYVRFGDYTGLSRKYDKKTGDHLLTKSVTMIKSENPVNLSERLTAATIIFLFVAVGAFSKDLSVGDATEHAIEQSSLTLPGSKPFHLKFDISETSDPDTD